MTFKEEGKAAMPEIVGKAVCREGIERNGRLARRWCLQKNTREEGDGKPPRLSSEDMTCSTINTETKTV